MLDEYNDLYITSGWSKGLTWEPTLGKLPHY